MSTRKWINFSIYLGISSIISEYSRWKIKKKDSLNFLSGNIIWKIHGILFADLRWLSIRSFSLGKNIPCHRGDKKNFVLVKLNMSKIEIWYLDWLVFKLRQKYAKKISGPAGSARLKSTEAVPFSRPINITSKQHLESTFSQILFILYRNRLPSNYCLKAQLYF